LHSFISKYYATVVYLRLVTKHCTDSAAENAGTNTRLLWQFWRLLRGDC